MPGSKISKKTAFKHIAAVLIFILKLTQSKIMVSIQISILH